MGPTLQALIELQEIESQIADIRRQLASKERQVQGQANRLRDARAWVDTEHAELRKSQAEVDGLDLELKSRTASIAKLREQLNSVRTNKEYAATLTQMNTEKADSSKVEAKALELMSKLEARKQVLREREQVGASEAARLNDLKAQLEQAQRLFAEKLAGLQTRRDAASKHLKPDTLALFNRVAERYDGEALAKVVRINPRKDEFVCNGCHMSVSAERANALLTRDEVQTCKNCGQILIIDKDV
ncbi:MAG: zinc ribbon domain-containing protein [Phycisphaerae bacterium]